MFPLHFCNTSKKLHQAYTVNTLKFDQFDLKMPIVRTPQCELSRYVNTHFVCSSLIITFARLKKQEIVGRKWISGGEKSGGKGNGAEEKVQKGE